MGLLDHFDIALLMDTRTVIGGDVTTLDRSRHGIHAVLGDGVTPATLPTWDEERGLYTFNGSDEGMDLGSTDDAGILDSMGGIPGTHVPGETYMFYFAPFELGSNGTHTLFHKSVSADYSITFSIITGAGSNQLNLQWRDGFGSIETLVTPVDSLVQFVGKNVMFSIQRRLNVQEIWVFDNLLYTGSDTSEDARNISKAVIGFRFVTTTYMPEGTGLRFFGYAQRAFEQSQLRQLRYGHRSIL